MVRIPLTVQLTNFPDVTVRIWPPHRDGRRWAVPGPERDSRIGVESLTVYTFAGPPAAHIFMAVIGGEERTWCTGLEGAPIERLQYVVNVWNATVSTYGAGGRPPWSGGFFLSTDHFIDTINAALDGVLSETKGKDPTQGRVLGWLADHIDQDFGTCDESRITEWCKRANTDWKTLKAAAKERFRAGSHVQKGELPAHTDPKPTE
jgi:hypothetical protein